MVKVETKPVWTSSSFLLYAGGLTVLQGAEVALLYLAFRFRGSGELTAWSLLIFVSLAAIALGFQRADQWLPAGLFAFNAVFAWGLLVAATLSWWGWANGSFRDFHVWSWSRLLLEVLILLAATLARWHFTFPFIRLISAAVGAFFVIDLLTPGHGNAAAIVALLLGLAYLVAGSVIDKPSTFWLHLAAGFLVGIPILYWCHTSTFDFAVIAFMSLVYVSWAYWTQRSSWAVFGTAGFFAVAGYFVVRAVQDSFDSAQFRGESPVGGLWFVPLAIGLLGFWLVLLGMLWKWNGDRHGPVNTETKPVWTSSSFLVYTGGLTVLLGASAGLAYLATQYHGRGALAGWTLLFLAVIYGIAHALRLRGRWLTAGIFAFVSVVVWGALVLQTMTWIGWHPFIVSTGFGSPLNPLSSWSWSRMLFWILVLAAAWFNLRLFKFPLIRLISAVAFWLFLADLLTSFHGDWFAVVTLLIGLFYLAAGNVIDKPSAFWLHLIGGALIAGPLVFWFSSGDADFAVLSVFSLLFVLVGFWTTRSSWAVYGTLGFFLATQHYLGLPVHTGVASLLLSPAQQCSGGGFGIPATCTTFGPFNSPWAPALAYGLLGFWLVGLGLLGMRKKNGEHVAAVVATPTPPLASAVAEAPSAE